VLVEFLVLNLLVFGGVALCLFAEPLWLRTIGMLASMAGGLGFGTNAHTASHRAASASDRLNSFLTVYGFGFMLGVAPEFWRDKHVRKHHHAPNVWGKDDDIDIGEPFSVVAEKLRGARGWRAKFYRFQWLIVPVALLANGFAVQKNGWTFLLRELKARSHANSRPGIDLSLLALHYAVWVVLPCAVCGPALGIGVYLIRIGLMGYVLFAAFAPAHFPAPALLVRADCQSEDYVLRQTATTLNFKTGLIGRFLCAGVEYQIEHHLFPTICHVYYPRVAPAVKAFCLRHGYPYRRVSWAEGIWRSYLSFYRPKLVKPSLRTSGRREMTRMHVAAVTSVGAQRPSAASERTVRLFNIDVLRS
jgi:fatty acid desaturase